MSFLLPRPDAILSQHKLVENDECVDTYQGHYIVEGVSIKGLGPRISSKEGRVRTAARTSHQGSDAGDEMNDLRLDASIGAGTEGWIVRSGREIDYGEAQETLGAGYCVRTKGGVTGVAYCARGSDLRRERPRHLQAAARSVIDEAICEGRTRTWRLVHTMTTGRSSGLAKRRSRREQTLTVQEVAEEQHDGRRCWEVVARGGRRGGSAKTLRWAVAKGRRGRCSGDDMCYRESLVVWWVGAPGDGCADPTTVREATCSAVDRGVQLTRTRRFNV